MSTESQPKKIGGEYGKVRANIDIEKLNAYLAKNVAAIKGPVDVKQFKVRMFIASFYLWTEQFRSLGRWDLNRYADVFVY